MKFTFRIAVACLAAVAVFCDASHALTVPFTEDFTNSGANWGDNVPVPATHFPTGGPDDDGYISGEVAFTSAPPGFDAIVAFRAENGFNSSGDAFVGNWSTAGVGQISAYFRIHGSDPLTPFVRVATTSNFPGFTISASQLLTPNQWTKLVFDVDPANPLLTAEGPPSFFNTAMASVGNVQFGVEIPAELVGDDTRRTFDLDRVTIRVPEPGSVGMLCTTLASVALVLWRRCR